MPSREDAVHSAEPAFSLGDLPVPLVFATHRIIRDCNEEFAALFGYERGELIGQSFHRLYPALTDFVLTGAMWRANLVGDSLYEDQRVMQRRDGHQFWAFVRGRSRQPADPLSQAVYCFQPMARPVLRDRRGLTERRLQILAMVAQGKTSAAIAEEIGISRRTIEAHRARTMKALGLHNSAALMNWFLEQELIRDQAV